MIASASTTSAVLRVYLRVSTDTQDLASQKHAAERWIMAYWTGGPVAWYVDDGVKGDAETRPELDRLKAESAAGDTVLCFAIDRLGRDGIVPVVKAWRDFQDAGVRVVSLCEPWADTANPASEVVIAVMAWAAQQEKKRNKERQRAGIAAAKAAGKKWGGSKLGRRLKLTKDKERKAIVLLNRGLSPNQVGSVVKLSRSTIERLKERLTAAAGEQS